MFPPEEGKLDAVGIDVPPKFPPAGAPWKPGCDVVGGVPLVVGGIAPGTDVEAVKGGIPGGPLTCPGAAGAPGCPGMGAAIGGAVPYTVKISKLFLAKCSTVKCFLHYAEIK